MVAANRQVNLNTESVDNYLKAILTLGGPEEKKVASTALATYLGIAPASVTNMLQKLAAVPSSLVQYERHHGVSLSPKGRKRALEIVRHHRLIETFLYEVLDYPIEEVHEEAERLEHFISERFEERIAAKLGYPEIDPHGHFIPAMDGKMPKQTSTSLADTAELGLFVVDSLADQNPSVLRQLKALAIERGIRFEVKDRTRLGDYVLRPDGARKELRLPFELAGAIRVHPVRR
jgi:DtxR family Mn-dependent transcriptional regulator